MSDGDDGASGVAAAIDDDLLDGIILEIVIEIIDYLILLVATLPQLFLSNPKYHGVWTS